MSLIYSVELNFSEPSREMEWHAWYETYLMKLVSLDGLDTAQRFRAVSPERANWEFLALYSLHSLDVYESDAYRNMGGGGNASSAYRGAIIRRRNVYNGIARMPEVREDGRRQDAICRIRFSCRRWLRRDLGRPGRHRWMEHRNGVRSH